MANMTGVTSPALVPEDPPTRVRTSQDQLSDVPIHDNPPPADKMSGAGYDVVVDVDEEVSY